MGGARSIPSWDTEGQAPSCAPGSRNGHGAPRGWGGGHGTGGVASSKAQPKAWKHIAAGFVRWREQHERKHQKDKSQGASSGGAALRELRAGASTPGADEGKAAFQGATSSSSQGKAALGKGIFLLVVRRTREQSPIGGQERQRWKMQRGNHDHPVLTLSCPRSWGGRGCSWAAGRDSVGRTAEIQPKG